MEPKYNKIKIVNFLLTLKPKVQIFHNALIQTRKNSKFNIIDNVKM